MAGMFAVTGVITAMFRPTAYVAMKYVTSLKKRCKDCRFVKRRGGALFIACDTKPRHKQKQGKGRPKPR